MCLERVPDGVSNAPEVIWSILEFLGFREILQNEVWESGGTLEGYREYTVQEALFRHLEMSQRGFATVQGNLHLYFSAIARSSPFNT